MTKRRPPGATAVENARKNGDYLTTAIFFVTRCPSA